MKIWQVVLLVVVLLAGLAAGLFYGWVIDPVTYVDTNAASLRIDYQTDIVLMIAEVYSADLNKENAELGLVWLDGADPIGLVENCLEYATRMNFSEQDLEQIAQLLDVMQTTLTGGNMVP